MRTVLIAGLLFIIVLLANRIQSDQLATTPDNRKVLLKSDGTWRFASQSDLIALKLADPSMTSDVQSGSAPGSVTGNTTLSSGFPGNMPNGANFQNSPAGSLTGDVSGLPGSTGTNKTAANVASSASGVSLTDAVKTSKEFDFRQTKWGWSKQQVKTAETCKLIEETPEAMKYQYTLIGHNSTVIYSFVQGKLTSASYALNQDDVNPAKFVDDFQGLKTYLRKEYGMPIKEENSWKNDIYKADPNNWGFAISLGFLTCRVVWKSASTQIALNMDGAKHIINTAIEYSAVQ